MATQNVEFAEALKILAQLAGVTLKRQSGEGPSKRDQYERAMAAALKFFRAQLTASAAARSYSGRRGLDAQTLDDFEIGYAPEMGEALAVQLQKEGCSLADCRSLFLVEQDASGGYFDRFRGRLMFPIRDERGALVAFGGRLLGDGIPKYINSGDTPLYSKRRVLYGLNRAKEAMAKSGRAVLVEGYLDAIACSRAGVPEAVASLGTSMSEDHAKMLRRWCEEVVILYDSDPAGQKAAERATEMLEHEGLRVRIALMPDGEDPDTLLRTLGAEAVREACGKGLSPLDYRIRRIQGALAPKDPQYWTQIAQVLATAPSFLEVETHIVPLAAQYPGLRDPQAAERALRRQIQAARRAMGSGPRAVRRQTAVEMPDRTLNRKEEAVFLALLSEELRPMAFEAMHDDSIFVTDKGAEIARSMVEAFPSGPPSGAPSIWLSQLQPEEIQDEFARLAMRSSGTLTLQTLRHAIAQLQSERDLRSVAPLKHEATSDDEKLREIQERLKKTKSERHELLNERRTQGTN